MKESYKKWNPVEKIDRELFVEALHDDSEGMRIILSGKSNGSGLLRISFSHYHLYRNVDESNRTNLWGGADFEDKNWSLFEVENSKLIDWLSSETGESFDKSSAKHYFIKSGSDTIDIVTHHTAPETEWLLPLVDDTNSLVRYSKRTIHKTYK